MPLGNGLRQNSPKSRSGVPKGLTDHPEFVDQMVKAPGKPLAAHERASRPLVGLPYYHRHPHALARSLARAKGICREKADSGQGNSLGTPFEGRPPRFCKQAVNQA